MNTEIRRIGRDVVVDQRDKVNGTIHRAFDRVSFGSAHPESD